MAFELDKRRESPLKIAQVLNNNVAVIQDRRGVPAIVMGRGIAFGKRKGDQIDRKKIEKTFKMHDEHTVEDLSGLLKDVPDNFVKTSYSLIEESQEKYGFKVESYLYVTLTMHLYSAYQRIKKGRYQKNYVLPDLGEKFPVAYEIADDFLAGLKKQLGIEFPVSERSSIALHFINAHGDQVNQTKTVNHLDEEIMDTIIQVLKAEGINKTDENEDDFNRLMTHIKYFVLRLQHEHFEEHADISMQSIESISKDFPKATATVNKIGQLLYDKCQIRLSKMEGLYLIIHVERLIEGAKE